MHVTSPQTTDKALTQQSVRGSREAFGLLVARHARLVRAICMARLGREELEDAVQEVFLRAFKGLGRLKDDSKFTAYLGQIARNYCVDRLRSTPRPTLSLSQADLDPPDPSATQDTAKELLLDRLRREVGRLPESQREVLLLFYFEKMSYAGMAAALGVTEAAVNQRLSRARQQLRASFDSQKERQA